MDMPEQGWGFIGWFTDYIRTGSCQVTMDSAKTVTACFAEPSKIGAYSEGNWYLDTSASWQWDGVPTETYGLFGVGLGTVTPVTGTGKVQETALRSWAGN
jgi:hypothetical protein